MAKSAPLQKRTSSAKRRPAPATPRSKRPGRVTGFSAAFSAQLLELRRLRERRDVAVTAELNADASYGSPAHTAAQAHAQRIEAELDSRVEEVWAHTTDDPMADVILRAAVAAIYAEYNQSGKLHGLPDPGDPHPENPPSARDRAWAELLVACACLADIKLAPAYKSDRKGRPTAHRPTSNGSTMTLAAAAQGLADTYDVFNTLDAVDRQQNKLPVDERQIGVADFARCKGATCHRQGTLEQVILGLEPESVDEALSLLWLRVAASISLHPPAQSTWSTPRWHRRPTRSSGRWTQCCGGSFMRAGPAHCSASTRPPRAGPRHPRRSRRCASARPSWPAAGRDPCGKNIGCPMRIRLGDVVFIWGWQLLAGPLRLLWRACRACRRLRRRQKPKSCADRADL